MGITKVRPLADHQLLGIRSQQLSHITVGRTSILCLSLTLPATSSSICGGSPTHLVQEKNSIILLKKIRGKGFFALNGRKWCPLEHT